MRLLANRGVRLWCREQDLNLHALRHWILSTPSGSSARLFKDLDFYSVAIRAIPETFRHRLAIANTTVR